MRYFMALLVVLVLALPAFSWTGGPSTTMNQTNAWNMQSQGPDAYYDFDATTDSGWLNFSSCKEIAWEIDPDTTGAGAGGTVHIRSSFSSAVACSAGEIVTVERNGDGVITAADQLVWDGTAGNTGASHVQRPAPFLCVDVVAVGANPARVKVKCFK